MTNIQETLNLKEPIKMQEYKKRHSESVRYLANHWVLSPLQSKGQRGLISLSYSRHKITIAYEGDHITLPFDTKTLKSKKSKVSFKATEDMKKLLTTLDGVIGTTVLEGEFLEDTNEFILSDCLIFSNQDLRDEDYMSRFEKLIELQRNLPKNFSLVEQYGIVDESEAEKTLDYFLCRHYTGALLRQSNQIYHEAEIIDYSQK